PGSSRPMPMPALAISMTPSANPAQSLRLPAGATAVANSSSSPISANRHWPSKRWAASTRSSRLSARSMAPRSSNGSPSARNGSNRSLVSSKDGCSPNAPGCHVTAISPRRSITCSSAGRPSPAFSAMAASAYRTTPPSALCVASLSGAAQGYSPAPIREVSALPRCTPSSPRQNSTASIHRPGLPTYCVAVPIIRPPSCTSSSPGTGTCAKPEPLPPDNQTIVAFAGCLRSRRASRALHQLDSADRQEPSLARTTKSTRLKEKLVKLKEEMQRLKALDVQMLATPDQQISLTDPDARSMATSGRGSGVVGYNVQVAVDTKHHLIVTHEVTNVGNDRSQLAGVAKQT